MSNSNPTPHAWQDQNTTPAVSVNDPPWRRQSASDRPRSGRWSRGRQLLVAFALFAVASGILIWFSLWLQPARGTCVMILYAGYEDNLAIDHNAYGRAGGEGLAALARGNPSQGSLWSSGTLQLRRDNPRLVETVESWDQDLAHFPERTLLLYFAMHGGADANGAYLVPQKTLAPEAAGGDDPTKNVLRLEKVLDRLRTAVPKSRNIVLVLDCTQIEHNLPLGMLHNTFADELEKLDHQIAGIPNLVVLSASGKDERSWVSQDLGQTIFSHFLIEGLKGSADGADPENDVHNGRVNAFELHRYVSLAVSDWTWRNRAAPQTPTLYPKGKIGEGRARAIHLTIVPKDYQAPTTRPRPVFVPTAPLLDVYSSRDRLAAQVPAPAAYAPQLWRLYHDMLLRYEDLLQAGETKVSGTLPAKLRDIEQGIALAKKVDLDAQGSTLAMPAVTGAWGPADKETHELLNRLWDAPAKDLAKEWANIEKQASKASKAEGELLRLKLSELALQRCVENTANSLEKTNQILHVLDNPLKPRAAEAHFLVMLHRDLVRTQPGDLASLPILPAKYLKTALEIRQRAERAAVGQQDPGANSVSGPFAYSEQVMPWIRDTVTGADELRRAGHDMLFSTDSVNWDRGRDLLLQADKMYEQAQDAAARVRLAVTVRDRVLPMLPYYSRWLTSRTVGPVGDKPANQESLRQQAFELWPEVHALCEMLTKPALAGAIDLDNTAKRAQLLQSLSESATRVQGKFAAIQQAFLNACTALDDAEGINDWHALDDVLRVPAVAASVRAHLVVTRTHVSRELFNTTLQPAAPGNVAPTANVEDSKRVKSAAVWLGKLTLAALGQKWVDYGGDPKPETYGQLQKRLANLTDKDWPSLVTGTGATLGGRWRNLPVEIARRTAEAKKDDPAGNLRAGDRLVRLLDGAGSLQLAENVARLYRHRLLQDLLLWQGQRTLLDHWTAEEPSADLYYQVAGQAFLKDAKRLQPSHEGLKSAEKQMRQEQKLTVALAQAPGLLPGGPSSPVLHWTSEDEFLMQFRLGTVGTFSGMAGHPMAWWEPSAGVEVVGSPAGQRLVQQLGDMAEHPLLCPLRTALIRAGEAKPPARPIPADAKMVVHALFRGQHLRYETHLLIHPVADNIVTSHPLPAAASIAVRAPGELHSELGTSRGAVAIVLDCTGSMGPRKDQPVETSKYYEATEALKDVLRKVPRGTVVSVWIFGQAVGATKTATNPADTIEQILPPTSWNPEDTDKIKALVTRARTFEPWNLSPIFRAMYTAAQKDLAGAGGSKTLLVITDGMDNCFEKDDALNGGNKDPRAFLLKNFADIQVNVIGFKFADREEEEARKQFAAIAELTRKGQFFTVNESRDLAFQMQKMLPQKLRYTLETPEDRPLAGLPAQGMDVSQSGRDDQWLPGGLAPGAYKVHLGGANPLTQDIALNRGDLLLLELTNALTGKQVLQRVVWSESDFASAVSKARENWRFAVLQNQRVKNGGLEMLMSLEKQGDSESAALQMAKPAKVWLEVTPPPEITTPFTSRWHYEPGYPAPAWSCDVPAWPSPLGGSGPARPTARVWWSQENLIPAAASLQRGRDFKGLADLANRKLRIEEDDVVIESVTVEDHLVELQPGLRGSPGQLKTMPCLVVRLAHGRGNPVWVSIRGLEAAGQEHRFYQSAGKYTGIFWPFSADQAAAALTALDVHSLTAFKRDAELRKCTIELRNLYEPLATELRPMQPIRMLAPDEYRNGGRLPELLPVPKVGPG